MSQNTPYDGPCIISNSGLVPMVVEQTAKGERSYDIFSRLLKEYPNLIHKLPLPVIEAVQVSWKPQRSSFSGRGGRDGDRGSRGSGDRPRSGGGGFRGRRGDSSSDAKPLRRFSW